MNAEDYDAKSVLEELLELIEGGTLVRKSQAGGDKIKYEQESLRLTRILAAARRLVGMKQTR